MDIARLYYSHVKPWVFFNRTSKCELAKVMNRQTCFQEILKQKDEIILDLDEKLGKLGGADIGYDSKKR